MRGHIIYDQKYLHALRVYFFAVYQIIIRLVFYNFKIFIAGDGPV